MTAPEAPPSIESMLAYRAWVRGLARSLVNDESRVDDVEQATWLAAIERPPEKRSAVAGWLRSVVRSRAIDEHRAESRRAAREQASARPEATAPTDRLVERAEILRDVAAAVCALDEPYRGTVLLRHFEDLEPREIAARQGISVETVHTRLRRAHEQLRARLDREHGDRRAWCVLLVPLAAKGDGARTGAGVGTGAVILGGLTMGKVSIAAACVIAAVGGWWFVQSASSSDGAAENGNVAAAPPAPAKPERVAPRAPRSRAEADTAPPTVAAAPAPTEPPKADGAAEASGRVVWADTETPVKHFEFLLVDGDVPILKQVVGDDGKFTASLAHAGKWEVARLVADGDAIAHFHAIVDVPSEKETVLRVPRTVGTAFLVLDAETGAPITSARAYAAASRDKEMIFWLGHNVPGRATLARPPRKADGGGRVSLGGQTAESEWYVVADGHEWMGVKAAPGATAEVRLRAAGSLRLSVPRWKELEDPTLDIYEVNGLGDDQMRLPRADAAGELLCEGLLPGRHDVVVRRGDSMGGLEYGRGEVEIVAGVEARLTIDAQTNAPRKKVVVTGTLHVPQTWREWPTWIHVDPTEPSNCDYHGFFQLKPPAQGRDVTFTVRDVPEGKYRIAVDPFSWSKDVVVGPGPTQWKEDLGPTCDVVVKVVDDATGNLASGATLQWYLLPAAGHWPVCENAGDEKSDGAFTLQSPAGAVHVEAKAPGLAPGEATAEAASGTPARVTIRLMRGAMLVVNLEVDGKPFTESEPRVSVTRKTSDGDSTTLFFSTRQGTARADGLALGPCTVEMREIDLSAWTCSKEDVVLKSGETTTVTLKLTRKP